MCILLKYIFLSLSFDILISVAACDFMLIRHLPYKKLIFSTNRLYRENILHKKKASRSRFATVGPENIYRGELCSFPRNDALSARISSIISHVSPASMHDVISEGEEQENEARRECEG